MKTKFIVKGNTYKVKEVLRSIRVKDVRSFWKYHRVDKHWFYTIDTDKVTLDFRSRLKEFCDINEFFFKEEIIDV